MPFEYKPTHRRNLPHLHPPGATFFVTFRLFGSIPKSVLNNWKSDRQMLERERDLSRRKLEDSSDKAEKDLQTRLLELNRRWFVRFEDILHKAETGSVWLKDPRIAKIVSDSLHELDRKKYDLHTFSIMSNHVHVQLTPFLDASSIVRKDGSKAPFESSLPTLSAIMQSLKGYTAREANKLLGRQGRFWQPESYDHKVRNQQEFARIERYILNNPVKAGLVQTWQEWPWNYVKQAF